MRVFLFGLSPWCINLVNLESEIVQLVLSILVFITYLIYLPHVYMYLCSSYCLLCMFLVSDSSIYMIYCRSFKFSYVICCYLYLHTWITSLDHVHVYLLCTPSGFIICTRRVASDNPRFSCPDPRDRTLVAFCSRSKGAADPSVTIGAQQKLGLSSQLFLSVPLLFGSRDPSCCLISL